MHAYRKLSNEKNNFSGKLEIQTEKEWSALFCIQILEFFFYSVYMRLKNDYYMRVFLISI